LPAQVFSRFAFKNSLTVANSSQKVGAKYPIIVLLVSKNHHRLTTGINRPYYRFAQKREEGMKTRTPLAVMAIAATAG
jgi:hypothetical protein